MPTWTESPSDVRYTPHDGAAAPLDEIRLASMADEGGVSAALMELEDDGERTRLLTTRRRTRSAATWRTAAAVAGCVGIAALAVAWFKRNA